MGCGGAGPEKEKAPHGAFESVPADFMRKIGLQPLFRERKQLLKQERFTNTI